MHIQADQKALSTALGHVKGAAAKKSTMPVLSHVRLTAGHGVLQIDATNLDITMGTRVPCDVKSEGAVCVPAQTLHDVVKGMPGPSVTLKKLDNHYVEVVSGRTTYKLAGVTADEFPKIPEVGETPVEIGAEMLRDLIAKTLYSVSTDETRYILNGVYLFHDSDKDALTAVSTDGHRLSVWHGPAGVGTAFASPVIVPRPALTELGRLLGDDAVGIALVGGKDGKPTHLHARVGDVTLAARLIDGRFPDYRQVIPEASAIKASVERRVLADCLKRVGLMAGANAHGIVLALSKDLLRVSGINPDLGEATEEIPVDYAGADLKIGFNARYLADAVSALDGEAVELGFNDELSPGVLRGVGAEGYACTVMPMRIS